jgi:uncharacterized protein
MPSTGGGGGVFKWDDKNVEHIARHGVEPFEAEEALMDPRRYVYSGNSSWEDRFSGVGATEAGWLLAVVYTLCKNWIRIITARGPTAWERQRYRKRLK